VRGQQLQPAAAVAGQPQPSVGRCGHLPGSQCQERLALQLDRVLDWQQPPDVVHPEDAGHSPMT
jgi:hypothetical protein